MKNCAIKPQKLSCLRYVTLLLRFCMTRRNEAYSVEQMGHSVQGAATWKPFLGHAGRELWKSHFP
jgi:hypothetical protein